MSKNRAIVPNRLNALSEQQAAFVAFVSAGISATQAAKAVGYSVPDSAARALLNNPAIKAELISHNKAIDTEFSVKSRNLLISLMDSDFSPSAIKAKIALELLKRADLIVKNSAEGKLEELSEADLMRLVASAQERLKIPRPDVV